MKQAINTRTQEEYDAIYVKCIEKPDKRLIRRGVTVGKIYKVEEDNELDKDYLITDDDGLRGYFLQRFFEIIPYTEFAKTIEPDYKALYLEGRELIKNLQSDISKLLAMSEVPHEDRRMYTDKIKAFLTKHNDLT